MKNIINKREWNKSRLNSSWSSDKNLMSEKFNDFFVSIGSNLAKKIISQNLSSQKYMEQPLIYSMFLNVVTPDENHKVINSLKNAAAGYDELTASILKMVSSSIISPIAYLCNLSFDQGVFPSELKLANVTPLYNCIKQMTLIVLLIIGPYPYCVFCRRFLNNKQFGFRKLYSYYMALMALMDKLINSLEKEVYVVEIFLDFSKAFDTVDHDIMLQNLSHHGIRGSALNWFSSYLADRKQFVTYISIWCIFIYKSHFMWSSIIGPLPFLITINFLWNICKLTTPILFADDTNLFSSGTGLDIMECIIDEKLTHISECLKVNKLSLNIKKTQYMVFTTKKKNHQLN